VCRRAQITRRRRPATVLTMLSPGDKAPDF
jgi:hypothetical protein